MEHIREFEVVLTVDTNKRTIKRRFDNAEDAIQVLTDYLDGLDLNTLEEPHT